MLSISKRNPWIIFALAFLGSCSVFPSSISPTSTVPPTLPINAEIDTYLTQLSQDHQFSGSVLVAQHGDLFLSKGYGFADVEQSIPITTGTRFLIGSMDKQFTAMAILILQVQAQLDLQDPLCDYLTECPSNWYEITIHHLLTHSAGIPDFPADIATISNYQDAPLTRDEIIQIYLKKPLLFSPGEKYSYSTPGYLLLAHIIEQVSGQSYKSFLKHHIFDPLEMNNTAYDCRDENLAMGLTESGITSRLVKWPRAYSICTTLEDLFMWDQSLYSEKLVPYEMIDLMFATHIQTPDIGAMYYGYGWFVGEWQGHKVAGHGGWIPGSGFRSFIQHYPDDELAIIVLSNQADSDVFGITSKIAEIVFRD
jgi:CubicO group peptidase (beta-lactamase class C family)